MSAKMELTSAAQMQSVRTHTAAVGVRAVPVLMVIRISMFVKTLTNVPKELTTVASTHTAPILLDRSIVRVLMVMRGILPFTRSIWM